MFSHYLFIKIAFPMKDIKGFSSPLPALNSKDTGYKNIFSPCTKHHLKKYQQKSRDGIEGDKTEGTSQIMRLGVF